jgi:hypothetical protein
MSNPLFMAKKEFYEVQDRVWGSCLDCHKLVPRLNSLCVKCKRKVNGDRRYGI